jgi:hypothetical protein
MKDKLMHKYTSMINTILDVFIKLRTDTPEDFIAPDEPTEEEEFMMCVLIPVLTSVFSISKSLPALHGVEVARGATIKDLIHMIKTNSCEMACECLKCSVFRELKKDKQFQVMAKQLRTLFSDKEGSANQRKQERKNLLETIDELDLGIHQNKPIQKVDPSEVMDKSFTDEFKDFLDQDVEVIKQPVQQEGPEVSEEDTDELPDEDWDVEGEDDVSPKDPDDPFLDKLIN